MCVLIVEDEYITGEFFSQYIRKNTKYNTKVAHSKKEALKIADELRPEIIFMDIALETRTAGIEACNEIKAKYPDMKIYMVSAFNEDSYREELDKCLHNGYIDKISFTKKALSILR